MVHNFCTFYSNKTSCIFLKFRNLAIIVLFLFEAPSIIVFLLQCARSISMSRSNCNWFLMISCNFFSLCDHNPFCSSIIPLILRLSLQLRFSKSFSLSLISFIIGITGCCWYFWFYNNSFFKLSRVLKFPSHWSVWNCRNFSNSATSFFNTPFSPIKLLTFLPFVQDSSWKSLLLIAHEFSGYL